MVLFFGVFLAVLTVFLNMLFIPKWGMNGAGFATLLAFLIYNGAKIFFVKKKFGIHPFSVKTLKATFLFTVIVLGFFFWDFPFHPIFNIALKSVLIVSLSVAAILQLNLSADINGMWNKFIAKR